MTRYAASTTSTSPLLRAYRIVAPRRVAREVEYTLVDEHIARIVLDAIRHSAVL